MLRKKDKAGGVISRTLIKISDEHFLELEKAGNIWLNPELRLALNHALNEFDSLDSVSQIAPENRDVIIRAEELLRASQMLYDFFAPGRQEKVTVTSEDGITEEVESEPIKSSIDKALLARLKSSQHWKIACDLHHARFRHFSGHLESIINHHKKRSINEPGRNSKENLNRLVSRLIEIYEDAEKQKLGRRPPAGTGKQTFIESFFELIPKGSGFALEQGWDSGQKGTLKAMIQRVEKPLSVRKKRKKVT